MTELHRDRGAAGGPARDPDKTEVIGPVRPDGRARPTGPTTVRTVRPKPAPAAGPEAPRRRPPTWLRSSRTRAWVTGTSTALTILGAVLLGFLAEVVIVGGLQHGRDQEVAFADLREQLANGTAAVGPTDLDGNPVPKGTPVALLRMGGSPELTEVVRDGTSADVLTGGVGHRRDTVLPGQAGVSVLMGRRNLFGGPFSRLESARPGQLILVTTGQAKDLRFQIRGVRRAGDPLPPVLAAGRSRLTLVTTTGRPFAPDGLLYVDADLIDGTQDPSTPGFRSATLPADELPLGMQWRALVPLTAWGAALMLAAIATSWLRLRWGRWQAWTVAVPTLGFLGIAVADAAARLLPNLL